ncbi:MAG TPA: hydantoinase B/oxoprolinase family protein [Gaiellaceae bacterium]|jgi:N-methylhydantoinase B
MRTDTAKRVDPITLEVIRNALPAIANEMSLDLQRSSYNMMIYEVRDYCCSLLNTKGELLSQNLGGVSHFVADLGVVIRDGIERYGMDGFAQGDVLVTNHQRVAGQHLNNVVVYTPVFHGERLRGFAAIRAHWVDVGGLSTGFGASTAYDAWAEGLQLDQVKLWRGGEVDETLYRVLRDNIRFPDSSLGDLRAQVAACRLAERRVTELDERYGSDVVDDAVERIFMHTEEHCRNVVAAIPDGIYEARQFAEGDPIDGEAPIEIAVKVTVSGSDMEIDLSGGSQQRKAPVNSRTYAGAYVAYKAITGPLDPVNEGSFRAVKAVIPEGNMMMAAFPAPMAGWSDVIPTVVETVFLALAPALPEQIAAGHLAVLGTPVVFFGHDPVRNRRFVSQSIEGGGWGGRPFEDGESASVSICQGDVRNSPIETIELKVPLLVEERALVTNSGGPGKFRGGLGLRMQVRCLVEGRWNLDERRRKDYPPWGLAGGLPGGTTAALLKLPDEETFTNVHVAHHLVPAGTVAALVSAGGGGWGDPLDRDPERVLADVIDGVVTMEAANEYYGVVVEGNAVDKRATEVWRERLRVSRSHSGADGPTTKEES